MNQATYDRFKELRQGYYLGGRCLLINQLFGMAGINFGYCIELSLKFVLAFKNHPQSELMKHDIEYYYNNVVNNNYIPPLNVSFDFLRFVNDRLNARYPSMIAKHLANYESESRIYLFTIDMLHCYDDFILQLDDALCKVANDPRISIGFRSCRDLLSVQGRIFFHCNDHAFARISNYIESLSMIRDPGDNFEYIEPLLKNHSDLWNFKGLMSYRPWGPKSDWSPASTFEFPKFDNGKISFKAAQWQANNVGVDMYLSSSDFTLPKGEYGFQIGSVIDPKKRDQ